MVSKFATPACSAIRDSKSEISSFPAPSFVALPYFSFSAFPQPFFLLTSAFSVLPNSPFQHFSFPLFHPF
jgi:hypothetical protein